MENDVMGTRYLLIFFSIVYFSQGIGQMSGVLHQPLEFYMKETLKFNATQIAGWLAVASIPWTIKPLYGIISDCFPIFGSRRKGWILVVNVLSSLAFLGIFFSWTIENIVICLFIASAGTAFCDVATDAVMVEHGKRLGLTDKFQGTQWMYLSIASIVSALLGGQLCQWLAPTSALRSATLIASTAPIVVFLVVWLSFKEDRNSEEEVSFSRVLRLYAELFKKKSLICVALFLALWNFSPSFGLPLYYFQTDVLKFNQSFIGQLDALGYASSMVGAYLFLKWLSPRFSTSQLLKASILFGGLATGLYVFMQGPASAIVITLIYYFVSQLSLLVVLGIAARSCPVNVEGFCFATLMSILNLSARGSSFIGSYIYDHVFGRNLTPLIIVSALFTLAIFFFLPLLAGSLGPPDNQGSADAPE